jgi:hypothetical protein
MALRLVDALAIEGVAVFCPRKEVHRRMPRRNRVEVKLVPLFGGMFFCRESDWPISVGIVCGVDTSRIKRMTMAGQPVRVKTEELAVLPQLLRDAPVEQEKINPGDWVVVKAGPLAGMRLMAMRVARDKVHGEINGVKISFSCFLLCKERE